MISVSFEGLFLISGLWTTPENTAKNFTTAFFFRIQKHLWVHLFLNFEVFPYILFVFHFKLTTYSLHKLCTAQVNFYHRKDKGASIKKPFLLSFHIYIMYYLCRSTQALNCLINSPRCRIHLYALLDLLLRPSDLSRTNYYLNEHCSIHHRLVALQQCASLGNPALGTSINLQCIIRVSLWNNLPRG